ncbi:hypothetical protein FE633_34135 [Streptomyces montanus]|uniref:Secreted protein n=1 Tax=Streptomyces montanus TaxID=2580423 RepID=A0A5R9FDH2_9ACTN|nr:hypothetical protein [Streptomyces montanus]TLS41847.1 hypothetical protein FE633_34135 [Streptomyces montanus]
MRKSLSLLAVGAGAVLTLGLTGPVAQAQDAGAGLDVLAAQDVPCSTGVSESDYLEGYADCTNNTAGPVEFRVNIGCGLARDVSSEWVRLEPGQGAQAVAGCPPWSTGIVPGGVSAEHRAV